jgi:pyruvate dehydrogenase E2 component (dihydrolipoamide acetyltransferase)
MAIPVIMPKLEMSQEEATVVEWLKRDGESVEKGEPLLRVETDKVIVDIESPASGLLAGVRAEPRQKVPVTEVIAYILQPGEGLPPPGAEVPLPPPPQPAPAARVTPVARQLAAAQGMDLSTVAGTGVGGRITKTDVEAALAAPARPVLEPFPARVRATPAARRISRERRIDLAAVSGSGPRGRVQAADVLAFAPPPAAEIVPLQGMRRTIAERMTASYQTTPHVTFTVRVEVSGFEQVRARLNALAETSGGVRVSTTALIVKAVAWALRRHPWLNSTLRGQEVHLLPEVNVGVAVALEEGLIVPVVHQADRKSLAEIAAEVNDLVTRAREGQLTPADVGGGTFTVSNLGPFGIEQFTAIINPPQAAILAVGAIQREVIADQEDQVIVRPVMRMTLSADHRVVDGAVAAHFLLDLRQALEAPTLLLW